MQDDDEAIREIISAMLREGGYRCSMVGTSVQVQQRLRTTKVELILCGLLDWREASLRALIKKFPEIPVIAMTATQDVQLFSKAMNLGCYDFLWKPFHREQLLFAVQRGLEHHRLKVEVRKHARLLRAKEARERKDV